MSASHWSEAAPGPRPPAARPSRQRRRKAGIAGRGRSPPPPPPIRFDRRHHQRIRLAAKRAAEVTGSRPRRGARRPVRQMNGERRATLHHPNRGKVEFGSFTTEHHPLRPARRAGQSQQKDQGSRRAADLAWLLCGGTFFPAPASNTCAMVILSALEDAGSVVRQTLNRSPGSAQIGYTPPGGIMLLDLRRFLVKERVELSEARRYSRSLRSRQQPPGRHCQGGGFRRLVKALRLDHLRS